MTEMKVGFVGRPKVLPPPAMPMGQVKKVVQFGEVAASSGHRVLLYGPGGIGKTTLASQLPGPVAFIDLDESLSCLRTQLEDSGQMANIVPVMGVEDWQSLRDVIQSDGWDKVRSIVIDTGTRAEEMAVAHTLAHTLQDSKKMTSIEGYGFGKGYGYVFDTFLLLLGDLDRHARAGRNVVVICHDCTSTVPNPTGEDWIRFEPRLQSPSSGKSSIRLRLREWADHVLFVGYDVSVNKDGKGTSHGTRTLYTAERPHCMAKSRTTQAQFPLGNDAAGVWEAIIR